MSINVLRNHFELHVGAISAKILDVLAHH